MTSGRRQQSTNEIEYAPKLNLLIIMEDTENETVNNNYLLETDTVVKDSQLINVRGRINRQQIVVIVILSCASFAASLCFSLIVPFFPEEAESRGVSQWMTGFILSVYQLAAIVSGPFFGKYGNLIGFKFLIVVGNLTLGASTILFGILEHSPKGLPFIALCMAVRFLQGLSGSAIYTATFAVVAKQFPDRVTVIVGTLESSSGLAYIVGPIFGGSLYQVGGFILPFLICGGCQIIIGCLSVYYLNSLNGEQEETKEYYSLLKIPQVWLAISSLMVITTSMSFFDLTIAPFLDTFGINALEKGLMLCTISGTYMVMGPIWGRLVDKWGWSREVMAVGALIDAFGLLFLGPSPILTMKGSLLSAGLGMTIMGFGIGAQCIPPFTDILKVAKTNGFPDDVSTISLVSGMVNSCQPFGAFIGPAVGGFVVAAIGFSWSTTGLAGLNILIGLILIASILKNEKRNQKEREPLIINHHINT
ncbi:hypothetical protein CHUAL_000842 [Chamberlinius hualienensis]